MDVKGQTAEAIGSALSLDSKAVRVLAEVLRKARAEDPAVPENWDELRFCVDSARYRPSKGADLKISSSISDAIGDYQERASTKPNQAAKATGGRVALMPKEHAEFTFYPTKAFREKCGVEHEDVGLFLDPDEAVLLENATVKAGAKRTVVVLPQGKIELNTALWEVRKEAKAASLKKYTVRDWSYIEQEYRTD